jgi:NAD(P)-dependent dehydrogenase (short-subunit alcohol dehydrogenase family)
VAEIEGNGGRASSTEAEFDETFTLNVKVPFFLAASLASGMAERGWEVVNQLAALAPAGRVAEPEELCRGDRLPGQ